MRRSGPSILWIGIFGAATGCATATPSGQDKPDAKVITSADAPIGGFPDAPIGNTPDARPGNPDAMPQPVAITLSESNSATIGTGVSRACANSFGVTAENSYYRAFKLSDFGINSAFNVTSVQFAVESAVAEVGTSQNAYVRIYNYTGAVGGTTLDTASMSQLANQLTAIPNTTSGTVTSNVTATIPAGGSLVAEIFVPDSDPDGDTYGNELYMGANTSGETKPSYIRAPDCGSSTPSSFDSLGLDVDLVITVSGTYLP